jgi:hypothetical protein
MNDDILSNNYTKLVVETENGEKIAEVTNELVTPADGYVVRLTPSYPFGG